MTTALSQISTNYDITLRFIVDNVREFLEPDDWDPTEDSLITIKRPPKRRTESFGPSLFIDCKSESTADGEPCMSCRLFAGATPYSGPITWSVCGESLSGDTQYFQYSLTHTFVPSVGIGWREALSKVNHWDQFATLREENALCITATVRAREGPCLSPDRTLAVSYVALTQSEPSDLRFIVYQTRRDSGRLSRSRELFANTEIIEEACPRLGKCVKHPRRARYSLPELLRSDNRLQSYHHSSDFDDGSDYEEDDEVDSTASAEIPDLDDDHDSIDTSDPEPQEIEVGQDIDIAEEPQHVSVPSSHVCEGSGWCFNEPKSTDQDAVADQNDVDDAPHDIPPPNPTPPSTVRTFTVVGAASPTWEAFLFYLYTGEVVFAPLTSKGEEARRIFIANHKDRYPRQPAPCSPKSMYRIAHRLEMKELQALALKYFASQISKENVISELFTKFTSQYQDIMDVELRVLREHWEELKHTEQVLGLSARIVRGELPHAMSLLAAIVPLVQLSA